MNDYYFDDDLSIPSCEFEISSNASLIFFSSSSEGGREERGRGGREGGREGGRGGRRGGKERKGEEGGREGGRGGREGEGGGGGEREEGRGGREGGEEGGREGGNRSTMHDTQPLHLPPSSTDLVNFSAAKRFSASSFLSAASCLSWVYSWLGKESINMSISWAVLAIRLENNTPLSRGKIYI